MFGSAVVKSTRWPPAGAGSASCTATGIDSPAMTIAEAGNVTSATDLTASVSSDGVLTFPEMSTATARRFRIAPAASVSGTLMVKETRALPIGGDTGLASDTVNAPWPVSSTRATAISSSASAKIVTGRPRTMSVPPVSVVKRTVGATVSATGRMTRAAVPDCRRDRRRRRRASGSGLAARSGGTWMANDAATEFCAGLISRVCVDVRSAADGQRHRRDAAEIVRRDDDGRGLTRIHLRARRSPRDRHRRTDRVENGNGDRRGLHDVPVRIDGGCIDGDGRTWRRGRRHRERKRFGPAGRRRIEDSCRRVLRLAGVCLEAHLCQAHVVAGADIHHNAIAVVCRRARGRRDDRDRRRLVCRYRDRGTDGRRSSIAGCIRRNRRHLDLRCLVHREREPR